MKMKPSDSAQQPIGQRENSIHITSKSWARKVDDKITLLHVWAALKVTNKQKKIHTHTRTWTNFGFDTTQRISSLKILDRSFWQQNHQTTFSHLNQYLTTNSWEQKFRTRFWLQWFQIISFLIWNHFTATILCRTHAPCTKYDNVQMKKKNQIFQSASSYNENEREIAKNV